MVKNDTSIKVENVVKILTYIIALIGFLSVVSSIRLFFNLSFIFLFLFSLYFEYKEKFLIPRWVLNTVSLAVIVSTFVRITTEDIVTPAMEALLILLAIKSLENKKFRDYMQIYAISLFLLAGSALLSIGMEFIVYFISLIFLLTAAMVLLTYYTQDSNMELKTSTVSKIVLKSFLITLMSIPLTMVMFIFLPRTNFPVFSFLNRGGIASAGFTDKVKLGVVANIQEDTSVILRVNMDKVDENLLYWRGVVIDYFDGNSWEAQNKEEADRHSRLKITGKQVVQTVYLEPYENRYLFALDKPVSISLRNLQRYTDVTYTLKERSIMRIKYQALSTLTDFLPEEEIDRDIYLQLPDKGLKMTKDLVRNLFTEDEGGTIKAILKFLSDGNFKYSLQNLPVSDNPLEDFLFKHKYGNCEYFASAMAVMLRMAGIPARIVGGYKGGYYNEIGKYYMVPQKNAHVWVEAHLKNKGWLRIDPTPAAIENFVSPYKKDFFFRAKLFFDTINYYWTAIVINYDLERQMLLFYKISSSFSHPKLGISLDKGKLVRYSVVLMITIFSGLIAYHLIFKRETPDKTIVISFLKKMDKYGYEKSKSEGLEEFTQKIKENQIRENAYQFAREFEKIYYKDRKITKLDMYRLKQLIKII